MYPSGPKKITLSLLALGFAAITAVSLSQLSSILHAYRESAQVYVELTRFVTPQPQPHSPQAGLPPPPVPAASPFPQADFAALSEVNPDIAAWLILEGSRINYPVVQGADNSFYLSHLFDGTPNPSGALFIDSYNEPGFADQNTVIYGHNMKDDSMFSTLLAYRSQEFFEQHPQMLLLTPRGNYLVELFAGYQTGIAADSWRHTFADASDFESWVSRSKERSDFTSDVEVLPTDRLLTLSTCSFAFDNARYVLVGKLVETAWLAPNGT